jgi:hypothetical protein
MIAGLQTICSQNKTRQRVSSDLTWLEQRDTRPSELGTFGG